MEAIRQRRRLTQGVSFAENASASTTQLSFGHFTALPFDCCALSMSPYEDPVCTKTGALYDLLNIVPYIKKHRQCPVTGQPLGGKDLIRLTMSKNGEGKWQCPILCKPFAVNTHVVAIRPTGNVFSYEAVKELNLKTKTYTDLIDGTPFDPAADIITLQNPKNPAAVALRSPVKFHHISSSAPVSAASGGAPAASAAASSSQDDRVGASGVRANAAIKRVLEGVAAASDDIAAKAKKARAMVQATGAAERAEHAKILQALGMTGTANGTASTGAMAASFTSSAQGPITQQELAQLTDGELREARWRAAAALKKKAYVAINIAGFGSLNLQLHVDRAPATCDNFLTLAARGYYNGVSFHRLIPKFMLQGGDPSGKGTGGECAWGGKFEDEFEPTLVHEGRGVLSMANAGPGTNGSQFFVTFASAPHLNNKHSVFGQVVGGMAVLDEVERVPTNDSSRPRRALKIESVTIFENPLDDCPAAPGVGGG